ncbi:hypothetical protein ACWD25_32030 [Streptomyces sp. NPDC002920]
MTGAAYELAWYGCDLRTGAIAEELRSLTPTASLSRRLGDSTSTTLSLALAGAPDEWQSATDPGRTLVVAVDTLTGDPIWAGQVNGPREGGTGDAVSFPAVTLEEYLDRRYTGDYTAIGEDDAQIIADLITPALTGGLPFVLDVTNTGTQRDYSILDTDDRTCLSAVQEIMGLDGGPEWTIDVEWADAAKTRFRFPIRIKTRIGVQSAQPEGTFDLPGCVSTYTLSESYEADKGATWIRAYGDTSGAVRLQSDLYTADAQIAAGWPVREYRFTPSSNGSDQDALNSSAAAALALMAAGGTAWTIEAVASRAPRLGRDWGLGDNIRLKVESGSSQRHPVGVDITARAWAWELDPGADTVQPILVEED